MICISPAGPAAAAHGAVRTASSDLFYLYIHSHSTRDVSGNISARSPSQLFLEPLSTNAFDPSLKLLTLPPPQPLVPGSSRSWLHAGPARLRLFNPISCYCHQVQPGAGGGEQQLSVHLLHRPPGAGSEPLPLLGEDPRLGSLPP